MRVNKIIHIWVKDSYIEVNVQVDFKLNVSSILKEFFKVTR